MLTKNIVIVLAGLGLQFPAVAEERDSIPLTRAIEMLEKQGLTIIYSSDLVRPEMTVIEPASASHPREKLEAILRPHALAIAQGPHGALLIVRASSTETEPRHPNINPPVVVVEASRYALVRDVDRVSTQVSAAEIRSTPNLGDDPLRALARLPGTTSNDFSARLNIRGGDANENLIRLDGMRLHNPFHLKDFQSLFSAIDTSFVDTIDLYTGGFPANLGDRMSGVIDIKSVAVTNRPQRELSLSLFHASGLLSGHANDENTDWVVSARRGNLDMVLDLTNMDIGAPRYLDAFGRITHRFTDESSVTGSFLGLHDDIQVNDSDFEENARATYRDLYTWLTYDYRPTDVLSARVLLSRTELRSERSGTADQPGIGSGSLRDDRAHTIDSLAFDAEWSALENVALLFGGDWRHVKGDYSYSEEAFFDMLFQIDGTPQAPERTRTLLATPKGDLYSLYSSLRLGLRPDLALDLGLRWDRSTLPTASDSELSPRVNVLYELDARTQLRVGWGRYAQTQSVDELQISDGVTDFFSSQRSEQWILSAQRVLGEQTALRLELYRKRYDSLHPRFENLLNTTALLPELKPDRIALYPTSALAEGAEISLRRTGRGPLMWWASYAWTQARDRVANTQAPRSWDQTHAISTGVSWTTPVWQTSLAASYHTGWPSSSAELLTDDPLPIASAERNSIRLKNYLDIDLRVAREFRSATDDSLTVFFELSNVLNRNNDCCIEYEYEYEDEDEDGERFLELERVKSLSLLPSLGFIYRF